MFKFENRSVGFFETYLKKYEIPRLEISVYVASVMEFWHLFAYVCKHPKRHEGGGRSFPYPFLHTHASLHHDETRHGNTFRQVFRLHAHVVHEVVPAVFFCLRHRETLCHKPVYLSRELGLRHTPVLFGNRMSQETFVLQTTQFRSRHTPRWLRNCVTLECVCLKEPGTSWPELPVCLYCYLIPCISIVQTPRSLPRRGKGSCWSRFKSPHCKRSLGASNFWPRITDAPFV